MRDTQRQRRRHLLVLALVFTLIWGALAIAPHDREDWLLENALVFAFAGALLATRRWFAFSRVSYP